VTADEITAYYVDRNAGGMGKLIQSGISTMLPYSFSLTSADFTFSNETRVNLAAGATLSLTLPFSFPFYDRHYGAAFVRASALVFCDQPEVTTSCTDFVALRSYPGIAPLWISLSLSGSIQPNEGLFIGTPDPDTVTLRWAGEYAPIGSSPSPVNFAAILH